MTTCLPSNAPTQCGKFQRSANSLWMCSQSSSEGSLKNSCCMLYHIVLHVSRIILDVVDIPILKAKANDFRESPLAKYLKDSRRIILMIKKITILIRKNLQHGNQKKVFYNLPNC